MHDRYNTCSLQVVAIAKHVLGYIVVGTTGLLLVAEKVKTTAILPGGHEVKTVITSKWHRIPLSQVSNLILIILMESHIAA